MCKEGIKSVTNENATKIVAPWSPGWFMDGTIA